MVPNDLSTIAEKQQVNEIVARVRKKVSSSLDNSDLERHARLLSRTALGDHLRSESIEWVKDISRGQASVTDGVDSPGRIRISHRLADVPGYVLGDVIVHELAHTLVGSSHTEEFWYWATEAPYHERARGYLEAYQRRGI